MARPHGESTARPEFVARRVDASPAPRRGTDGGFGMGLNRLLRASLLIGSTLAAPVTGITQARIHHELITELQRNPIEYRALIKRTLEGHLGALGLILTQRAPDSDLIPFHVEALVVLTRRHESLYPEGSATPATSERVWTEGAEFQKASQRTADLAQQLQTVVGRGDAAQSMNALVRLGESCQSCHARYRRSAAE
jgi:cytochrome c556